MKTNELRIGNYVNIEGDVVKVKEIYEKSIHYANSEYESFATEDFIQPIELTEELLCKINFCFNGVSVCGKSYAKTNGDDTLWCKICVGWDMSLTCNNNANLIQLHKVKYLHELQNAYYLLTNKELEVEL